jgi:hypothetical protein
VLSPDVQCIVGTDQLPFSQILVVTFELYPSIHDILIFLPSADMDCVFPLSISNLPHSEIRKKYDTENG